MRQCKTMIAYALIVTVYACTAPNGSAQKVDPKIETTVRSYFAAMAHGDDAAVRASVDKTFLAIESGDRPNVHVIDTAKTEKLTLNNDDWINANVSDFTINVTDKAGTVSNVAFVLTLPIPDTELNVVRGLVADSADLLTTEQKADAKKLLDDRAKKYRLFAILVRREDDWKIVSLVLPR